jgi:DNA-binding MarR family transcriptional regulator
MDLDPVIHQPARLRIVASLAALPPTDAVEFTALRDLLGLTDGNLGAHIKRLEEGEYITVEKTFVDRKPRTFIALTTKGRQAFKQHVAALEAILRVG